MSHFDATRDMYGKLSLSGSERYLINKARAWKNGKLSKKLLQVNLLIHTIDSYILTISNRRDLVNQFSNNLFSHQSSDLQTYMEC
jgi:hypothetical protein